MSPPDQWEASQIAAGVRVYIGDIEESLKGPMVHAKAHLIGQVGEIFAALNPIVGEAISAASVNLPWDDTDA